MSEETILVAFSHDGKKFELEVDPERPISHLMDRIEELTDVPPGNMKGNIYSNKVLFDLNGTRGVLQFRRLKNQYYQMRDYVLESIEFDLLYFNRLRYR